MKGPTTICVETLFCIGRKIDSIVPWKKLAAFSAPYKKLKPGMRAAIQVSVGFVIITVAAYFINDDPTVQSRLFIDFKGRDLYKIPQYPLAFLRYWLEGMTLSLGVCCFSWGVIGTFRSLLRLTKLSQ
jgi:hypothetical protein